MILNITCLDCGPLPTINYGTAYGNGTTTVGMNVTVNCSEGYNASSDTILCQSNGTWSSVKCIPEGNVQLTHLNKHFQQCINTRMSLSWSITPNNIIYVRSWYYAFRLLSNKHLQARCRIFIFASNCNFVFSIIVKHEHAQLLYYLLVFIWICIQKLCLSKGMNVLIMI